MGIAEIEALIREYLAAGLTAIVVIVLPPTPDGSPPQPSVSVIQPDGGSSGAESGGGESGGGESGGNTGSGSAESGNSGAVGTADEGTTAAAGFGWGTPNREDNFDGTALQGWNVYDGPGHADNGRRTPDAASVRDGILTITGDAQGSTAGMAWDTGQRYGRWEGRVRAPASDESYNALLLLWPDAEDFPVGGEIDFMEMTDHTRQSTDLFLHYGEDNSQVHGEVQIDATQWHNWAVEWTPEAITAYVDGQEWYRNTDTSIFPPRPMHLCVQLDWFPEDGKGAVQESYMYVDWVRQYSLDGAAAEAESGAGSGSGSG